MSGTCRYFPNQTQLTNDIYAVFNKYTDLMLEKFDVEGGKAELMVADHIHRVKPLGGFSIASVAQNPDPSNLVVGFVVGYNELKNNDKELFRGAVKELSEAIAREEKRNPGSLKNAAQLKAFAKEHGPIAMLKDMMVLFSSHKDIMELLVNQRAKA